LLAGLERADSGSIRIDGVDAVPIPVNKRQIGFVFQNYALFGHMSVARNIAFGLEVRRKRERPSAGEIKQRVEALLELVQLPGYGNRLPHQLSGGQRQRVALARALAIEPKILLLDEPFGALDAKVRTEMRVWLKELQRKLQITTVFVTHDQEEALEMADRIVVMRAGGIEQIGTPDELYRRPKNSFIYSFLGEANTLPCVVSDNVARTADGRFLTNGLAMENGPATLWFRPHATRITSKDEAGALEGTVIDLASRGSRSRVVLAHEGRQIVVELPADDGGTRILPSRGASCYWKPHAPSVLRN
jgi:sulfate transport system ATP-binding protein